MDWNDLSTWNVNSARLPGVHGLERPQHVEM